MAAVDSNDSDPAGPGVVDELVRPRTLFDALLAAGGLFTILKGWQYYTRSLPKPTDTDQVTRTDYISGNYERDLREREQTLRTNRFRGRLFVLGGIGLVGAGVFFLFRVMTASRTPASEGDDPHTNGHNGQPHTSRSRSSER